MRIPEYEIDRRNREERERRFEENRPRLELPLYLPIPEDCEERPEEEDTSTNVIIIQM